jgi:hypothetical protein
MLSPDLDFAQQGAKSHINYLKAFRKYRDMLFAQSSSAASTYRVLLATFNQSIFGDELVKRTNAICGGEGESEDEMEDYRRRLEMSIQPLPIDANITEDALIE